ncbi:hypothetical protein JQ615_21260 [Bradyrhizobium jicamae]|uniref:Animal haem peroxidase n=1 Tax=Bradyrhizobium jicamae TaxID=280332 RepID=A0ABS5FMF1_9BRAD|nr:peroxidase family protein [Bradyrhizobium jicamae]MBR0797921.1 hypothetical protein [Bradyrhizobium jicamae]MBR0931935.1 hypothetical protein [Bradyrhizobium jicamae]
MHGINLSTVPELVDGMKLLTADSELGGTQNLLGLTDASMFGAGKDPLTLRKLMRRLAARISRETLRSDRQGRSEDNPNLPSGYTYLLQFMAHDMVDTSISLAATGGRRFGFQNARQQPLTLDTIYGGGPDVSPQVYEYSEQCVHARGLMPRTKMRCGRAQDRVNPGAKTPYADIGRATPVEVKDSGVDSIPGNPQCLRTEALVADARNDDQALIAQMTLLFHRMHNFILDQLDGATPATDAAGAYRNFICARFILTLLYRRIIIKDVMYRLLDPSVYRYYFLPDLNTRKLVSDPAAGVPVEFSHGAFRCGHAMIRNSYRVRDDTAIPATRAMQFSSRRSPQFVPLTTEWIVKWDRFFELNGKQPANLSRRLRPDFSALPRSEFYFAPLLPDDDGPGLPNRDLVSAIYARLWSVPKLIDALRARNSELANFLAPYSREYAARLTSWLAETADPSGVSEQFEAGDIPAIVDDPPLPFFVLFEASVKHDGLRLGPLGSIIIAEAIVGAMVNSPLGRGPFVLDPMRQLKEQSGELKKLGVDEKALSTISEMESFEDLLVFMNANGLLNQ